MAVEDARYDYIEQAAILLARDHGAPETIRRDHVRGAHDWCVACRPPVRWPCILLLIAQVARQIVAEADLRGAGHSSEPRHAHGAEWGVPPG